MTIPNMKPAFWIASALKDLKQFPDDVQDVLGSSLTMIQFGGMPSNAKPLKGFGGAGVLEILDDFDGDTYRAVCTVRFEEAVYVLHCFQKKSKSGIKTPLQEMELIKQRLKQAESEWRERREKG